MGIITNLINSQRLFLPLAVLFCTLSTEKVFAVDYQEISGTVYVSNITNERVKLVGDTKIIVDKDYYLREIYGPTYSLRIQVNFACLLTVDQDWTKTAAVDVKSLFLLGEGSTLITGRNFGLCLRGGILHISGTTATFSGREHNSSADGSWTQSVIGETGSSIFIENSYVIFKTGGHCVSGFIYNRSFDHMLDYITIQGDKSKVYFNGSVGGTTTGISEYSLKNFNVRGGEVHLSDSWICLNSKSVNLTGGTIYVDKTGNNNVHALYTQDFNVSNCTLTMNSTQTCAVCDGITINNAIVNATGGGNNYALYSNINGITITGEKAEVKADAPRAGLYSEGEITIKCKQLWANASTKGYNAIWSGRRINIDLLDSNSTYEAQSNSTNPIYAKEGIYMEHAAKIFCIPYSGTGAGTQVNVTYNRSTHSFTTSNNAYSFLSFSAPSFPANTSIVKDVYVGETITFDLSPLQNYMSDAHPEIYFILYKKKGTNGTQQYVTEYYVTSTSWTYSREMKESDNGYIYWGVISAVPFKNWINTRYSYLVSKKKILGDVNEDGKVDINDVVAVINQMAGTATWPNANVNGDFDSSGKGIVDINDVVAIINIMAQT